jgi:uridine monophosphate synthetase
MSKITKKSLVKEIIDLGLFVVLDPEDKSQWFKFKNGSYSQYFLATAKIMAYPKLMDKINRMAVQIIKEKRIKFDRIMGIPYGALPFTYGIANIMKAPCLTVRREGKKKYGVKGDLLGIFEKDDKVLFIENVTVTANTVISFAERLKKDYLRVSDVVTICDTEKTARENLKKYGIRLHNLFSYRDFTRFYKKHPNKNSYSIR